MQKLVEQGQYFSDENMKIRNPVLWQDYVGKHRKSKTVPTINDESTLTDKLLRRWDLDCADEDIRVSDEQFQEEDDSDEEEETEQTDSNQQQQDERDFLRVMQTSFLEGKDVGFNYQAIDSDSELDNLEEMERDEQDRYFSDED
eukprot:TRINITY_DN458_c0_g1_i2.p1 TRINITY_DN458_c0_g1~~TRINITY_DN458_c0_g1_i2.p1  ORF type:complete len:144 (-),score=45.55 TRINITY_DN458_c0_g1_i2:23-454(-)